MSPVRSILRWRARQRGFTLLELLVVVLILSALAFVALDTLQVDTNHVRFEDTRNRLLMMRDAVIGPRNVSLNGQPVIAGFVADVGRLPRCVQELVERVVDCDDTPGADPESPREWVEDTVSGTRLYSGWRGPYISAIREQASGLAVFRDGWSNDLDGALPNHGWSLFDGSSGDLIVQSLGRDGVANTSDATAYAALATYEQDFPPTTDPTGDPTTPPDPLVAAEEYSLSLDNIAVTLRNDTAATITIAIDSLCLRLYAPDPDAANPPILTRESGSAPDAAVSLPPGTQSTILVPFASTVEVPWGRRAIRLFQFSSSTCTTTEYNAQPIQQISLIPQAAFPEVVWAAQ